MKIWPWILGLGTLAVAGVALASGKREEEGGADDPLAGAPVAGAGDSVAWGQWFKIEGIGTDVTVIETEIDQSGASVQTRSPTTAGEWYFRAVGGSGPAQLRVEYGSEGYPWGEKLILLK